MPLGPEDLDAIRVIIKEEIHAHFGDAWTPESGPQAGRRFVKAIVDSVWHATSSGRKLVQTVDETWDYAKTASKTASGTSGVSATEVADELAARLAD